MIDSWTKKAILNEFERDFNSNRTLTKLYAAVKKGTASEADNYAFAKEISKISNNIFNEYLLDEDYDYQEMVDNLIYPILQKDYGLIASYSSDVQKIKFEGLKLGLNPIEPPIDNDRAVGLQEKFKEVATREGYIEKHDSLSQKVENFNYHIVDEAIKQNAEFMKGSGFTTKITRTTLGETCEWCKKLAGTYYDPSSGDGEIFMRHDNCDCHIRVEYAKNSRPSYYMRTSGNAFVRSD